jgi:hypothetical protein
MTQKDKERTIHFNKTLRQRIDGLIQELEAEFSRHSSAERVLAKRSLQQARHWLGEDLSLVGAKHPYPNGNNPDTLVIDPAADKASPPVPLSPEEQQAYDEGRLAPGGEVLPSPASTEQVPPGGFPPVAEPGGNSSTTKVVVTGGNGHSVVSGPASIAGSEGQ